MPRVWKSRGAGTPSPTNPILVRWIATANTSHPMYADRSVWHLWRPFLTPTTTMAQLVDATLVFAREQRDRCPRSRGCLYPHGAFASGPLGQLFLQEGDRPTPIPFASVGNQSLYTAVGRADVKPRMETYLDLLLPRLAAEGIEPPGMFHLDVEPISQPGGYQFGADSAAGVPTGFFTPCITEDRHDVEPVYDALTASDVNALRVAEGYTYDDAQTAFTLANRFFNIHFVWSLPITSWAMAQAVYAPILARLDAQVSNYEDYSASLSATYPVARDHLNPQTYQAPRRFNYANAHAPALYPYNIINGASLVQPGETSPDFFVRLNAEFLDAILAGPQSALPIVPWISEPGVLGDGSGWTTDTDATFRVMKEAHARGAYVFLMWGNDNADPHADAVYSVWSQFRAWAAAQ